MSFGARRAIVVALLAGLGLAALAGGASGRLTTKKREVSVVPATTESATAKCRRGTRVASGGFDAPGFDSAAANGTYVQTFASARSGRRGWTSTATNFPYPPVTQAGTLVDYAYCDKLPRLKVKSKTVIVPDGEFRSATAKCAKGGEAVAGGFEAETEAATFDGTFPVKSRRVGKRSWVVTANSSGGDHTVTAFAYCARHKLGLTEKLASTSSANPSTNQSTEARCKRGQQSVSGGFAGPANAAAGVEVEPFQSKRVGERGSRAATASYSRGEPVVWNVYAYCMERG